MVVDESEKICFIQKIISCNKIVSSTGELIQLTSWMLFNLVGQSWLMNFKLTGDFIYSRTIAEKLSFRNSKYGIFFKCHLAPKRLVVPFKYIPDRLRSLSVYPDTGSKIGTYFPFEYHNSF